MRNNSMKLFEFGSVVQEQMLFKRFLIWSYGGLNHLCNFKRGHHGEHSCEVI